jgi:hypothetical protein
LAFLQSSPVIVKIMEPPPTGLAEVLLGALGLTGVMTLLALVFAVAVAALLVWFRSRSA